MKTKPELLKAFKKANKERRKVLAARAGFDTPDEYRKFLEEQILNDMQVNDAQDVVRPIIHNVHILDCSLSMKYGKFDNAVLGINKEVELLGNSGEDVDYIQSLFTFSEPSDYNQEYYRSHISTVGVYQHNRSLGRSTALYDAIGETLTKLLDSSDSGADERTVVKIFTDGEENRSRTKFRSPHVLSTLIDRAKEAGIVVTFVGTDRDVARVVTKLGIDESNTLVHNNTPEAVLDSFLTTTRSTQVYAKAVVRGEDSLVGFYKQSGTL